MPSVRLILVTASSIAACADASPRTEHGRRAPFGTWSSRALAAWSKRRPSARHARMSTSSAVSSMMSVAFRSLSIEFERTASSAASATKGVGMIPRANLSFRHSGRRRIYCCGRLRSRGGRRPTSEKQGVNQKSPDWANRSRFEGALCQLVVVDKISPQHAPKNPQPRNLRPSGV